ncbi:MAG: YfiR family protein, partial [bacterium]|nr:YfiR family protein [bacterium]
MLLLAGSGGTLRGQPASVDEYRVKAAFLYSIAKFVAWPASGRQHRRVFGVGIRGRDAFGRAIQEVVEGKTIG